ncbi:MAG: hypothetical protein JWR21_4364 [Herminiimonas sp.]|nr:hypothetical protein [Herminiimonas sp.]
MSTATHHIVELTDDSSGTPVLSVFVRNGEVATIKVPLGTYKVNMAKGSRWYGETKLFGTYMRVAQGIAPLEFTAIRNPITGHNLT